MLGATEEGDIPGEAASPPTTSRIDRAPSALIPTAMKLSKQMPLPPVGRMGDEELRAVYERLTQLPGL